MCTIDDWTVVGQELEDQIWEISCPSIMHCYVVQSPLPTGPRKKWRLFSSLENLNKDHTFLVHPVDI